MENQPATRAGVIKNIYFYLVCFVTLMMVTFSTADLINIALKTWVFTKADQEFFYYDPCSEVKGPEGVTPDPALCEKQRAQNIDRDKQNRTARKQMSVVRDISMILVGVPLFIWHWRILRKKEEV